MHSSHNRNEDSTEIFDDELTRRAIAAQQCLPLSEQRQAALNELYDGVQRQGQLWKPGDNEINEDIYNDAVQELWLYICQQIEKYDPHRATFMRWVNMLLPRRFYKLAFSKVGEKNEKITAYELNNLLEKLTLNAEKSSLLEEIKECISLDIEGFLKNEHIKNRPEVNFRALAQRRMAGDSWKTIALDVGISIQYLNKFYQISLKKVAVHIKEYICQ